jgi:hypothetical protein
LKNLRELGRLWLSSAINRGLQIWLQYFC